MSRRHNRWLSPSPIAKGLCLLAQTLPVSSSATYRTKWSSCSQFDWLRDKLIVWPWWNRLTSWSRVPSTWSEFSSMLLSLCFCNNDFIRLSGPCWIRLNINVNRPSILVLRTLYWGRNSILLLNCIKPCGPVSTCKVGWIHSRASISSSISSVIIPNDFLVWNILMVYLWFHCQRKSLISTAPWFSWLGAELGRNVFKLHRGRWELFIIFLTWLLRSSKLPLKVLS